MKKIDISTKKHPNTFALVDDCDFERLNQWKWHAVNRGNTLYAERLELRFGKNTAMHRMILGITDKHIQADHRDGNGLDNRRSNLRTCTHAENNRNKARGSRNTSGYKGVSWKKEHAKWGANICFGGKQVFLGYFFCLIKAAKAYDAAAKELHGEFARLNFPKEVSV